MNWINIDKYLDNNQVTYCEIKNIVKIGARTNHKHMPLPSYFKFLLKSFHAKVAVRILTNLVNTRQTPLEVKKRA